jgi:hypothetical protein
VIAAIAALARPATRRDAALALDRVLGLDERVATALETGRDFVVRDAERSLEGKDPRRAAPVTIPREGRLLAFTLPLAALLAVLLAPGLAAAGASSPLAEAAAREAKALEAVPVPADLAKDLERIVVELKSGDAERIRAAIGALGGLESDLAKRALAGGPDADALRAAAERAAAGAAALGRVAGGVEVVPGVLSEKMNLAVSKTAGDRSAKPGDAVGSKAAPAGSPLALSAVHEATAAYNRHDWDPKYEDVVRAYYEVKR